MTEEGERQRYACLSVTSYFNWFGSELSILLNLHLLISEEEILLRDHVRERAESRTMEHDGACLYQGPKHTILTLQISIKALLKPSKIMFYLLGSGSRIPK